MARRRQEAGPLADYGKRQKLKEQNRVALIEATLDSIAEVGFARTSVSAIIDRANLSRGMIHLHFGGKDALVEAAAKHSRVANSPSTPFFTAPSSKVARCLAISSGFFLPIARRSMSAPPRV